MRGCPTPCGRVAATAQSDGRALVGHPRGAGAFPAGGGAATRRRRRRPAGFHSRLCHSLPPAVPKRSSPLPILRPSMCRRYAEVHKSGPCGYICLCYSLLGLTVLLCVSREDANEDAYTNN